MSIEAEIVKATIEDIKNRVESAKGLHGKMSMGEWSYRLLEILKSINPESIIKEFKK